LIFIILITKYKPGNGQEFQKPHPNRSFYLDILGIGGSNFFKFWHNYHLFYLLLQVFA